MRVVAGVINKKKPLKYKYNLHINKNIYKVHIKNIKSKGLSRWVLLSTTPVSSSLQSPCMIWTKQKRARTTRPQGYFNSSSQKLIIPNSPLHGHLWLPFLLLLLVVSPVRLWSCGRGAVITTIPAPKCQAAVPHAPNHLAIGRPAPQPGAQHILVFRYYH